MEPLIKINNLTVLYDKGLPSEVKALDNINLQIFPQEFVIIFGPSGCGKSTLLYVLAGIERSIESKSEVIIKDKDLVKMSKKQLTIFHRESIGMIFQAFNLVNNLTVEQNIALPLLFSGTNARERAKKTRFSLARLNISNFAKRLPQRLSGGQQQRVGIARALVNDPEIILADEPTGNLDSENANNVLNMLQKLKKEKNKTIILVTHESQYLSYGSRIIYLKDGKMIKDEITAQKEYKKPAAKADDKFSNIQNKKELEKQINGVKNAQTLLTDFCQIEKIDSALNHKTENSAAKQENIVINGINSEKLFFYFGFNLGPEEKKRLNEIINNFFKNKISKNDLLYILDTSSKEGGAGLYTSSAKKLCDELEKIKLLSELLKFKLENNENLATAIRYIISWLTEDYKGNELNKKQYAEIYEGILKLIKRKIQTKEFLDILDRPFKDGGAGLDSRTAKNFTLKLNLLFNLNN